MELGMVGLGRMGSNMARRLMRAGVRCVVHDRAAEAVDGMAREGAIPARSLAEVVAALSPPRHVWIMVPAGAVDHVIDDLAPLLQTGDAIVDGGNSLFQDDIARATRLTGKSVHYVDAGVSGGVAGLERGYCLMIGGEETIVRRLVLVFEALAPGIAAAPPTPGRAPGTGTADRGWLHCGPHGAGHFVKMVHNAIEYGMMAAYAEGFNLLRHANAGSASHAVDAETTPLRHPEHYRYDFNVAEIAELWRRGSVIPSWLLDLAAQALAGDPALAAFAGRVSDSGEGRWTLAAANDLGVPTYVLAASLFERFASRGEADFQNRLLSALRFQFGGHHEKPVP
ncbi:MAG: 6-phosphogluconate dehydrogenase, NAD(+)-dependent, decarboxylating [Gemmatimonadaceae bacterium]|nr:6-phosphogluconate dehydrogenase, NAD(+)-dependent, decarboxylating [Gemmatimonadaceae bacterium]